MTTAGFKTLLVGAGIGSRLQPLTDVLPKCLMPIAGRPLLGIWLDILMGAGCRDVVLNLHHHAELVDEFVERSPYNARVTRAHEIDLLGTAGTLIDHRRRFSDAPFLFAHADNLSCFDVRKLLDAHARRPRGAVMTMMTFDTDTPQLCGIVETDRHGLVTAFHEKASHPPGTRANAAIYVIEPGVFHLLDAVDEPITDFSNDIVPRLLGRIFTVHNSVYHRDIGSLPSLMRAQLDWPKVATDHGENTGDPWYGMMSEDGGRLAAAFFGALERAMRRETATPAATRIDFRLAG